MNELTLVVLISSILICASLSTVCYLMLRKPRKCLPKVKNISKTPTAFGGKAIVSAAKRRKPVYHDDEFLYKKEKMEEKSRERT